MDKCPFCGGNSRITTREMKYYGQNEIGWKKIKFGAQAICNRCHARGGVVTVIIITGRDAMRTELDILRKRAEESWDKRI